MFKMVRIKKAQTWLVVLIILGILAVGIYFYSTKEECKTNQDCINKYQKDYMVCSEGKCYATGLDEKINEPSTLEECIVA